MVTAEQINKHQEFLGFFKRHILLNQGKKDALLDAITRNETEINKLVTENDSKELISEVLIKVAARSRQEAKDKLEKIVTNALQFSLQSYDVKFIIEEIGTRAKPSYEFYIEDITNGLPSKKKLMSTGGGIVDICSAILKFTYYIIFDDPKCMNSTLFLDEPGKMISEGIDVKFAQYIDFIASQFNCQPLMITHNASLASIAGKSFIVSNTDGVSSVNEASTVPVVMSILNQQVLEQEQKGGSNVYAENKVQKV